VLPGIIVTIALVVAPGVQMATAQGATATPVASPMTLPPPSANVSVFAEGLDNPRGLQFDAEGVLYVAEGGQGGSNATVESQCEQVVPPVGPYTGGPTARISTVDENGMRSTVVEGLPSNQTSPNLGSLVAGVADVAFIDGTLYALIAGGGCSHGHPDDPNGIIRVNPDGTTELVADLSEFVKANPVASPNPIDFEPDEGAYDLEVFEGELYVAESNHGAIDKVNVETGEITRVIDMSATEGHVVPTALAVGPDGNLYVSNLLTFPAVEGGAKVWTLSAEGELTEYGTGLTAVLGLAFDAEGTLYALETTAGGNADAPIIPGTGRVVRMTDSGEWEPVATGLVFPTAMTFGEDGNLYISNYGFGFPPGAGQIVVVDMTAPLPS
jgi:hypothetical protein